MITQATELLQIQVSWVRHQDVHILAVGTRTFTTDERFAVKHVEDTGQFTLLIRKARKGDEGSYECQISTKPTKRFMFHLQIEGGFLLFF